jgi:hypothetical protein
MSQPAKLSRACPYRFRYGIGGSFCMLTVRTTSCFASSVIAQFASVVALFQHVIIASRSSLQSRPTGPTTGITIALQTCNIAQHLRQKNWDSLRVHPRGVWGWPFVDRLTSRCSPQCVQVTVTFSFIRIRSLEATGLRCVGPSSASQPTSPNRGIPNFLADR